MGRKFNDQFAMTLNGVSIAVLDPQCFGRSARCNQPAADGSCPVSINNLGMSPDNGDGSWSPCFVNNSRREIFAGLTGYTKVQYAELS
jgi:hypothetical protein